MAERLEKLLASYFSEPDLDKAEKDLRAGVTSLKELRFIMAVVKQQYYDEYDNVLDSLISL